MDDLLPDGSGVAPTRTRTPSPTPSDLLRQEGNFGQELTWSNIFRDVDSLVSGALHLS